MAGWVCVCGCSWALGEVGLVYIVMLTVWRCWEAGMFGQGCLRPPWAINSALFFFWVDFQTKTTPQGQAMCLCLLTASSPAGLGLGEFPDSSVLRSDWEKLPGDFRNSFSCDEQLEDVFQKPTDKQLCAFFSPLPEIQWARKSREKKSKSFRPLAVNR